MTHCRYAFWIFGSICLSCLATPPQSHAQTIEADTTLTPNNSIVMPQPDNVVEITGGVKAGSNLFHSFREFSVPNGSTAYFNNAASIQNIISRVTGGNTSNIDGIIRANGIAANLFLLNPNGIIFGPNAQLNISGSFVASTANGLVFGDGLFFSATEPQAAPLLTISVPLGLQYGSNAGSIVNRSAAGLQVQPGKTLALVGGEVQLDGGVLRAPGGRVELGGLAELGTVGLKVDGNNLSLNFLENVASSDVLLTNKSTVGIAGGGGGSIAINAQKLELSSGSQLLAGIGKGLGLVGSQAGDITINATGAVTLTGSSRISNDIGDTESGATGNGGSIKVKAGSLSLKDNSRLQTSTFGQGNAGNIFIEANDFVLLMNSDLRSNVGEGAEGNGGEIDIQARSLSLLDGSQLQALTRGRGNAGNVKITVQDGMTIAGENSDGYSSTIFTNVEEGVVGNAGNINIATGSLFLSNGGALLADTEGKGNAGNVFVNARESVSLSNSTRESDVLIRSAVQKGAEGNGGKIEIQTRSLSLTGGAQIGASVSKGEPGGRGNGGSILVNATDSVTISGFSPKTGYSSGVFTATETGAEGSAGDITVNTGALRIANGAVINAQTLNSSRGGSVTIEASNFEAINGGQVITTASSSGNAGNITVYASDGIVFAGSDPTFASRLTEFPDNVENEGPGSSGLFASTRASSTGLGGDIAIATGQLIVRDGAQVSVSSSGKGNAGNLGVTARSMRLDNQGKLIAETVSGNGGNITLGARDLLLMRRSSQISTTAGGAGAGGDGGNIDVDTKFIVAVPDENSDITANAFEGRGGSINITNQGIFGIEYRKEPTPLSDITASSQFGISGSVNINTEAILLNQGLVELPSAPGVPELIQGCQARGGKPTSRFVITGRGGLPPNPYQPLDSSEVWRDVQLPRELAENSTGVSRTSTSPTMTSGGIVEATGWIANENGNVELVAQMPTAISQERCGWR